MNIIVCGVGGNGVVLTTRIIADAALSEGLGVKVGEVHGLAMRGGTVSSHLRIGSDAKGVLIPQRSGDILLAFEPLEAIRQMKFLKEGAKVILNNEPFVGIDAHLGLSDYPEISEVLERISSVQDLVDIDATHLAIKSGSVVMTNVVMLGALSASGDLPIRREALIATIEKRVPPMMVEKNIKAFEAGEKAFGDWLKNRNCLN